MKPYCIVICNKFVDMLGKKIVMWVLIFGIILPSETSYSFFSIIPNVLKHYDHHLAEHEKISFTVFLMEHLTENNHTDHHPEHQNSPFSHHHSSNCGISLYSVTTNNVVLVSNSLKIIFVKVKCVFSLSFYNIIFKSSIWQPPQYSNCIFNDK